MLEETTAFKINVIPWAYQLPKLLMWGKRRNDGMPSDILVHCRWQMRKAV